MSRIIVLEGPDGCGKSTAAKAVQKYLTEEHGRPCEILRAPGSTRLGEELRKVLLSPDIEAHPEELALMFTASLASVTRQAIELVEAGTFAVMDRWIFSMMVYQGEAGVPKAKLRALTAMFMPKLPDEVVLDAYLLSVPFEVCQQRLREDEGRGDDRFEGQSKTVAQKRWAAYEEFPDEDLQRVPGVHPPEKLAAAIAAGVLPS